MNDSKNFLIMGTEYIQMKFYFIMPDMTTYLTHNFITV